MKKQYIPIIVFLLLLCVTGCNVVSPRAALEGTVTSVHEGSILIDTAIGPCSVILPEGDYEFAVGDLVKVIYNGEIAESYPMQIHRVYDVERVEASPSNTQ